MLRTAAIVLALTLSVATNASDYSYAAIAERYSESKLDAAKVEATRMHGECLIGLKKINFQKRDDFDPVAEWTQYRAFSLLEQFPPCEVLIMIEVARTGLIDKP